MAQKAVHDVQDAMPPIGPTDLEVMLDLLGAEQLRGEVERVFEAAVTAGLINNFQVRNVAGCKQMEGVEEGVAIASDGGRGEGEYPSLKGGGERGIVRIPWRAG
jgi:hypothetical protein